jgi:UDP-N-acetylglucosamine transferase subunit ALG13
MIFVTIGTCEPFDRLLAAVDDLDTGEAIVAQTGRSTVQPRSARCVEFLPYDALAELVASARVVVTHAGVGSILTSLILGKRPIVVPRLRRFGDAVDDHQLELATRLADLGLVTHLPDPADLAEALDVASEELGGIRRGGTLADELGRYISAHTL